MVPLYGLFSAHPSTGRAATQVKRPAITKKPGEPYGSLQGCSQVRSHKTDKPPFYQRIVRLCYGFGL